MFTVILDDFKGGKEESYKSKQISILLCRMFSKFPLKYQLRVLKTYLFLKLWILVSDSLTEVIIFLKFWWKRLRDSGGNFCDCISHPIYFIHQFQCLCYCKCWRTHLIKVPVLFILSTLHTEQNFVSLKLNQNEADRISLCIVRNDDMR